MKQVWHAISYFLHGMSHNADGTFSSTKVWQAFGQSVSLWVIIHLTVSDKMSAEYLLIMLAATAGTRSFQTYLSSKSAEARPTDEFWNERPTGSQKTPE